MAGCKHELLRRAWYDESRLDAPLVQPLYCCDGIKARGSAGDRIEQQSRGAGVCVHAGDGSAGEPGAKRERDWLAGERGWCLASEVSDSTETPPRTGPELHGTAGYESPYPYMEKLQPRMDERLDRKVPVNGRFCGFCFGRLRRDDELCGFCGAELATTGTVTEIPQDVLLIFQAKKKAEEGWVHMGAFFGLLVAMGLFIYLVLWGPWLFGHPAFAFAVLILGGYVLAQFFGPIVGGQIGYKKGCMKRDELWAAYLGARGTGSGASRTTSE